MHIYFSQRMRMYLFSLQIVTTDRRIWP